jgi:hypothetical protein
MRALAVADRTARELRQQSLVLEAEAAHLYTALVVIRDDLAQAEKPPFAHTIAVNAIRSSNMRNFYGSGSDPGVKAVNE